MRGLFPLLASLALTALPASAQTQAPALEEEELLGGPNAPITLRTQQPKPIVKAPAAPAAKAAPAPKIAVAPKPQPAPKTVAAPRPTAAAPKAIPAPRVAAKAAPKPAVQPVRKPPALAKVDPLAAPERRVAPPVQAVAPPPEAQTTVLAEPPPEMQAETPLLEDRTPPVEIADPVPDRVFAQIDSLIDRAARRGDISPRTANAFADDLIAIADLQDDMLREGPLSAATRDSLERRLNALRDDIYAAAEQAEWRWRR